MQSVGGDLYLCLGGYRHSQIVQENSIYDVLKADVSLFPEKSLVCFASSDVNMSVDGYMQVEWNHTSSLKFSYSHLQRYVG
jgi:hypothetical protein